VATTLLAFLLSSNKTHDAIDRDGVTPLVEAFDYDCSLAGFHGWGGSILIFCVFLPGATPTPNVPGLVSRVTAGLARSRNAQDIAESSRIASTDCVSLGRCLLDRLACCQIWANSERRNRRSVEPAKRHRPGKGDRRFHSGGLAPPWSSVAPPRCNRGTDEALKWTFGPDICGQNLDRPKARDWCVGCNFGPDRAERVDTFLGAAVMLG
jgi:hypothetical protein